LIKSMIHRLSTLSKMSFSEVLREGRRGRKIGKGEKEREAAHPYKFLKVVACGNN